MFGFSHSFLSIDVLFTLDNLGDGFPLVYLPADSTEKLPEVLVVV